MFTGIIQRLGTVKKIAQEREGALLEIAAGKAAKRGESVAVNGACLTVTSAKRDVLTFDVVEETLRRTDLGQLKSGARVNLEWALKVGGSLSGHFVQGHIDGIGRIFKKERRGNSALLWCEVPPTLAGYLVEKGSVALDGVSLTLVDVEPARFSVALIPFTLKHTTLGFKGAGDRVNIEVDILAKYAQKLLPSRAKKGKPSAITLKFLKRAGFA